MNTDGKTTARGMRNVGALISPIRSNITGVNAADLTRRFTSRLAVKFTWGRSGATPSIKATTMPSESVNYVAFLR